MAEVDEVRKAKTDLEAIGQLWNTSCDAYRITNLVCLRNGWKLVQKTSGDNCQGRKVDGIIKDGGLYDCLVNAGPPLNDNEPSWNYQGPQNALVALDPLPDPDFSENPPPNPNPIPPDSNDINQKLDIIIAMLQDAKTTQAYDTKSVLDAIVAFESRFNQVVEDMEETLDRIMKYLIANGFPVPPDLPSIITGLFRNKK